MGVLRARCAERAPWQPRLTSPRAGTRVRSARAGGRSPAARPAHLSPRRHARALGLRRRSVPCRPPGRRLTPPRAGTRARPALQLARSSCCRRQLRARHVAHPACCSSAVLCAPAMLRVRCGCASAAPWPETDLSPAGPARRWWRGESRVYPRREPARLVAATAEAAQQSID